MFIVTVSEMLGTKGEEIARQLASSLNYAFYGDEEFFKASKEMGFPVDAETLDGKGQTTSRESLGEKPKIYLGQLQSVIYEMAKKGNAVFFGRGSQLLLNAFECMFHVLITGSMKKRIEGMMEEKKVSGEIAEKIIRQSDQEKKEFLRFAFDEDWLSPHLYDLMINTDKLNIDSAARMVLDGVQSEEMKTCSADSIKSIGKFHLHYIIESVLSDSGLLTQYLHFTVEDIDSVRLHGLVGSLEKKEKVENLLKGIKEIKKIRNDLSIFRSPSGAI
ncbi:MAG: AAA family ATPase [Thermodesulfobacteriota bacterium]